MLDILISATVVTDVVWNSRESTAVKDEIEGKKTSLLAQMYDRNRILVMLPIMLLNIS